MLANAERKGLSSAVKLAAVAALLVFFAALAVLRTSAGTVKVVVARERIELGEEVTPANAELKEVPRRAVPPGAATSLADLKGKRVAVPRLPGDVVTEASLAPGDAFRLPEGSEGFFVPLEAAEAGFLRPGMAVAVIGCPGAGSGQECGVFRVMAVVRGPKDAGRAEAAALLCGDPVAVAAAAPWVKSGNFKLAVRGE